MADDAAERGVRPPYASESVIRAFFQKMKTMGDPGEIDAKWVESYNLGGAQPHAVIGLTKWLGIADAAGKTTGNWSQLRTKQAETLAELVRSSYSSVFDAVDVETGDRDALTGAFIHAFDSGSTNKPLKAFLTLCDIAGIKTAAKTSRGPTPKAAGGTKKASAPAGKKVAQVPEQAASKRAAPSGTVDASVTFNVEIPAEWTADQVRQRMQDVLGAIGSATSR